MGGSTKLHPVVFDTNVIIKFINKEPGFLDLDTRFAGDSRFISIVTKMELLAFPGISADEKKRTLAFLETVLIIPLTATVEAEAIEVRRKFRVKLPDAIVAATALALGATLVTGDGPLAKKKMPDLSITFVPFPPTRAPWWSAFKRNKSLWTALGCFIISTLVFAILFILK
ncbi:hypothetical protein FACS189491_00030 [Spirochaetia bacterium]|nr:hypothetical protein FACS189491_00030 [Spirochaetia bacterium]